jgi:type II secretory pathway pseudopilin PulG
MNVTTRQKPPRGMTAVAVLICLIVVTMISGALLRVGLTHRDQVRSQEQRLQAEWLAESGIQRAIARLASDPKYPGETWEIGAKELDSTEPASIAITIDRPPDTPRRVSVRVRADYPRDLPHRSRHSKKIIVELEPTKAGAAT